MKLTNKMGLVFFISTFIYLFVLRMSYISYFILELTTLGLFIVSLTVYEAINIKDCKDEYKKYQQRQNLILNKN
jgi:hypothetical protein